MSYHLELFNNANDKRAGYLNYVSNVSVVEELDAIDLLTFDLNYEDELFDTLGELDYIWLVKDDDSSNYKYFIIVDIKDSKSSDFTKTVRCEGYASTALNKVTQLYGDFAQIAAGTILSMLLDGSGFTVGNNDIPGNDIRDMSFNYPTVLEGLQQIIQLWDYNDSGTPRKYHWRLNNDDSIDIRTLANMGSAKNFYIHYEKQMRGIEKFIDAKNLVNRVYGIGADGFDLKRRGQVSYVYEGDYTTVDSAADDGGNAYVALKDGFDDDDIHNGMQAILLTGSGDPAKFTITDSIASNERIYKSGNWTTAPSNGDHIIFPALETTENMTYVLGITDSNTDSLVYGSKVVMNWGGAHPDANQDGTLRYTLKVEFLSSADSILYTSTYRSALIDTSGGETDFDFAQEVEITSAIGNVRKLKFTATIVNTDTGAGTPYIKINSINYQLGPNENYLDDSTSQGAYGIIEGKYENPDIPDVLNLVKTPDFSGTYTGGLCADWTQQGSPTLAENTDSDYYQHGTKSQKVTASAADEGVYQTVPIGIDESYSAYIKIYIETGAVYIGIGNSYHVTSGEGWIEVTIENTSISAGYMTISVLSNGDAATFYIDAAQLTKGAEIKPFYNGDSVDILEDETQVFLDLHKDPIITYIVDILDLYNLDGYDYNGESFTVGDTVKVIEQDMDLADNLLVYKKSYDPYNPEKNCTLELNNKLPSQLDALKKAIFQVMAKRRVN